MVVCPVCGIQNDEYAIVCGSCKSYIQNRIANLDCSCHRHCQPNSDGDSRSRLGGGGGCSLATQGRDSHMMACSVVLALFLARVRTQRSRVRSKLAERPNRPEVAPDGVSVWRQ